MINKKTNFPIALKWTVLITLPVLFSGGMTGTTKPSKPNIVLVFLDDADFDDFAPFGEPRYTTPNVETLAEEGRSFYNFYVPQAVCSASRAVMMTGCYPGRTKVLGL